MFQKEVGLWFHPGSAYENTAWSKAPDCFPSHRGFCEQQSEVGLQGLSGSLGRDERLISSHLLEGITMRLGTS